MRVEALRRLRLRGRTIEQGEQFDLPDRFAAWLERGWVAPATVEQRVEPVPENRVAAPAEDRSAKPRKSTAKKPSGTKRKPATTRKKKGA